MNKENTHHYQRFYLDMGLIAIVMLSLLGYSYYSSNRMTRIYAPLVEAIEHIKLDITTAHLWFEEILSGDRHEKIDTVWQNLDQVDWYTHAILEGGEGMESTIIPPDDPNLRQDFRALRNKLTALRKLAEERFELHEDAVAGTDIDQQYDALFSEFRVLADVIEIKVNEFINQEIKAHRIIEGALTFITLFLFIQAGIFFHHYQRRQLEHARNLEKEITERKLAEERITRFSRVFEDSLNEIYIFDEDSLKFEQVNAAAQHNLGYTMEELQVLTPLAIKPEFTPESFAELVAPLRKGKKKYIVFETVHKRKNKSFYNVEVHLQLLKYENKALFTAIIVDITGRKRSENEMRQLRNALAHVERLHTMGEMTATLAHEMNQPLAAISSYAEGCIIRLRSGNGEGKTAEILGALEKVSEQAGRASGLIAHIRGYLRKEKPLKESLNMNDLIHNIADLLNAEAHISQTTIMLDLNDDLPLIKGDPIQLQQVILNIARNGIEAMRKNDPTSRRLTIITTVHEGDMVEVAVRDTGPGLSTENKDRFFVPFTTTKTYGLGMGLPISRTIVEANGGKIGFDPDVEGGSIIRFTLPVGNETPADYN